MNESDFPKRKRMRLANYDYSSPGCYFVTIVTQGRVCRFGKVINGEMRLNAAGRMVEDCYQKLEATHTGVECLDHAVMPNHLHAIIRLNEIRPSMDVKSHIECRESSLSNSLGNSAERNLTSKIPYTSANGSLEELIKRLKSMTTVAYIHGVREHGWAPFDRHLWQKGFYDHIIRQERVFNYIRNYILTNPERWYYDKINPCCSSTPDDINQGIKSLY